MSDDIAALPFEAAEYGRRVAGARARMAARGIDLLIVTGAENGYYLSGLLVGTPQVFLALVLPIEGDACWVVRQTELSNVRTLAATAWVKEGVGVPDESDPIHILAGTLMEQGRERARIGIERQGWFFHADYQHRSEAALPDATFLDSTGLVEGMRNIKGPAEIAYMKRAGAVTAAALRAGIAAVAAGVTDREIGAILTATAIREGSGPMPQGPFVTCGARSFMAHSSWAGAPIRTGEMVNTEMACSVARYYVPCFRVSVVGPPSDALKRFHGASEAGLEGALTRIRPGMTSGEADAAVREPIEHAGFGEYFVVRAAYGIGLAFGPCWSEDRLMNMRPGDDRVLEPGMCFHVVPALYKEGFGAVCCSMPVVVTESGLEPLIDLEPKLFVRG